MEHIKIKKLSRDFAAEDMSVDAENAVIEFSFSSELPVERWFGKEILSHADGACDLTRLNNAAPMLFNHDADELIGVVEKAWVSDGKGYVRCKFSRNECGQEKLQDVKDGIIRNVSVGYMIEEMMLKNPGSSETPEYIATKWLPFEVSLVTIPADPTVGIGRSKDDQEFEVRVINAAKPAALKGNRKMEETTQTVPDVKHVQAEAVRAERERISAITALGQKFNQSDLARQLIDGGKSIEEARAAVLEKIGAEQKPVQQGAAAIGMNEKEIRSYSFLRAIQAMMNPGDRKAQEAAKFEREVSDAAADKAGKAARGFIVPYDILSAGSKRDLTVGVSTAGGNTVATELLAGSFIELLRKKSIVQRAGATVMNGLQGMIAIPRHTSAATAYWVAENSAPTESQQAFDQVTLSPKTVGAFTDYSRRLLLQSAIDVETLVRNDLATVIALEIDRVALYGSGSSNQPQGLKTLLAGGAQEVNLGAAVPTFSEVVSLESKVTSANADVGAMKYLVNANMVGSLKTAVKVASYPVFILEGGQMNGYETLMSNQVASGDVWFGVWSQLMIGFWSGLDIMVDPYAGSTAGTVRVIALQDCDVAARHPECFARGNDNP